MLSDKGGERGGCYETFKRLIAPISGIWSLISEADGSI
jgi:hypothetical protein